MNREQLFAELSFPARSPACAIALLAFYVLMALAARAGIFGLWLGILVVPAMFRFLVAVAEARAAGTDVEPPGVELFTLGSHAWTLFAVVPALAFAGLVLVLRGAHPLLAAGVGASGALLLPAMIAVLVVTHAPLEAFNPAALLRVVRSFGPTYLLAPPMLGLIGIVAAASLPIAWLGHLLVLYLMFAVHALVGGLIREHGLLEAIEIPVDETIGVEMEKGRLERERKLCLNHAYALFSRGNHTGALLHLEKRLDEDPDPDTARTWYQERMCGWADKAPALNFGQQHVAALLRQGDTVRAVKLMLRLRLLDERFRPADADLSAAIEAARACGNADLAELLVAAETRAGGL